MNTKRAIGTAILLGIAVACSTSRTVPREPAPSQQASASQSAPQEKEPARVGRLEERFPQNFTTQHFGLYLFGEKAGFLRSSMHRDPVTDEIHEAHFMEASVETLGVVTKSQNEMRLIYASAPPHALLFEEEVAREGDSEERKVFDARGGAGRLGVFAGGSAHVDEGFTTRADLQSRLEAFDEASKGSPGESIQFWSFDIDRRGDELCSLVRVGREKILIAGEQREVSHLRQTTDGGDGALDFFFDDDGVFVKIRMGDWVEAVLEHEQDARTGAMPVDALMKSSVPVEDFRGNPEKLQRIEWEWSGTDSLIPERAGQSSRWKSAGVQFLTTIRMRSPSPEQRALPIPEDVRVELAPDSLCNSDHPRLRALAQEIAGHEPADPWRRVESVVDWLQENVEGSMDANYETALGVLDARQGDCTEFTVLASGILRAAGIPTRRVGGMVLVADSPKALLGHAWVEVWVGEWIPVDPALGQAPADCGHVCFGGERDSRLAGQQGMRAKVLRKR